MPLSPIKRQRAGEIHERVGRNVIRVQRLEHALKALVPFIDLQGAPHSLNGLKERGQQVARQTLGQLIGSFQENVSLSDQTGFDGMFAEVVADRNTLVHHFHATLAPLSATDDGHTELLQKLDSQFETIRALEDLVHGLLLGILRALRDAQEPASDSHADFASICREFESAIRFGTQNS